jgi:hypothetical protein
VGKASGTTLPHPRARTGEALTGAVKTPAGGSDKDADGANTDQDDGANTNQDDGAGTDQVSKGLSRSMEEFARAQLLILSSKEEKRSYRVREALVHSLAAELAAQRGLDPITMASFGSSRPVPISAFQPSLGGSSSRVAAFALARRQTHASAADTFRQAGSTSSESYKNPLPSVAFAPITSTDQMSRV